MGTALRPLSAQNPHLRGMQTLRVALGLLVLLLVLSCRQHAQVPVGEQPPLRPLPATDALDTLRLLFAGDAMQHKEQFQAARQPDGTYDYAPCLAAIKPYIEAADLAFVNLETTLPGPPYAGYPNFRSPDAYAAALVASGFDVITLANNHSVDAGNAGVLRTLQVCDSLGAEHLGTYRDDADRTRRTPLLITRKGIKLALLNYTYGTNYQFTKPPVSVNYIDTVLIKRDLAAARAAKPDAILVLFHWGLEYKLEPLPEEEQLAALCFREGARLVIGGHPHVVRRADRLHYDSTSVAVVYSMGNFLSAQRHPNTDGGMLAGITLTKDWRTGQVEVADAGYHLIWVNRRPTGGQPIYEVVPIADVEAGTLTPAWENQGRTKMDRFAKAAREVLGKNTQVPEMPSGTWLGRRIDRQVLRMQPLARLPTPPAGVVEAVSLPALKPYTPPPDTTRRRRR